MVKFAYPLVGLAFAGRAVAWTAAPGTTHIIKSILKDDANMLERHEGRRRLYESGLSSRRIRRLQRGQQSSCDAAFLGCLPDATCIECFGDLEFQQVDWTGVTPDTECTEVVNYLNDAGYCVKLQKDKSAIKTFCDTFEACVVWEDDGGDEIDPADQEGFVNCTALTECRWEGMKEFWIGDGICHDNMHGCYNTEICGYDGGDCCEDTCDDGDSDYKTCGQDGYACRDPNSESCDSEITWKCPNQEDEKKRASDVVCSDREQKYRLIMYDSFGDGWDQSKLTVTKSGSSKKLFEKSLEDGAQGTEYICLSSEPACYNAVTTGGTWGVEVSWEIKTMREGSPAIVGSGAPSDCNFPVAGGACDKTCEGRPIDDPTEDPEYKSFKELFKCISEKCVIQLGACKADSVCEQCFVEEAPDYCYGMDDFNAVLDCTMCSCTDRTDSTTCTKKDGPGAAVPPSGSNRDDDNSAPKRCSGAETMKGAKAVMDFSKCAQMDDIGIMVTEFDQSNFGQLDQFETCAHSYADEPNHGGHTALSCMQILAMAITNPVAADNDKNPPKEAISALAKDLYQNAQAFCDCAKSASDDCPLCPSFMSFKTLLYESLDACSALDEIDCDAWGEFWLSCQNNLKDQFGTLDLKTEGQCDFMKKGCGGAGAFPAFRRLDCDGEIESDAWDFYKKYLRNCLKGADGIPPDDSPVPKPSNAPAKAPTKSPSTPSSPTKAPASAPTLVPYIPSDDDVTPKPYVPPDERSNSKSTKSKSHWFRNLVLLGLLGGGGYYLYKRRFDSFNFMQYRRVRNFGNFGYDMDNDDSGGLYSNLNSSTTFEPPTLPPTPQMMGGNNDGGGMMGGMMSGMGSMMGSMMGGNNVGYTQGQPNYNYDNVSGNGSMAQSFPQQPMS